MAGVVSVQASHIRTLPWLFSRLPVACEPKGPRPDLCLVQAPKLEAEQHKHTILRWAEPQFLVLPFFFASVNQVFVGKESSSLIQRWDFFQCGCKSLPCALTLTLHSSVLGPGICEVREWMSLLHQDDFRHINGLTQALDSLAPSPGNLGWRADSWQAVAHEFHS